MNIVETIRIEDGKFEGLRFHNARFHRTRRELFGVHDELDLSDIIAIPDSAREGIHKCRVIYNDSIQRIEIAPYIFRKIRTLKVVHSNNINYPYKYEDRSEFSNLLKDIAEDDIVIVKNGFVTDASYANIAFFDGTSWFTPDTCLLPGTRREQLIEEGIIKPVQLSVDDIKNYARCKLINSMMTWDESPVIDSASIHF